MKKILVASFIAAGLASASCAQAADQNVSPWLIRLRGINIDPQSSSTPGGAAGIPENAISVENRWTAELTISYFFTKNIALELYLLGYSYLNVTADVPGVYRGGIGNVGVLPPSLLLQYHFNWENNPFKPYIGAGINFTWFVENNLAVPLFPGSLPLNITRTSWGPALQVGADYKLNEHWYLNADFKYLWIDTQVTSRNPGPPLVNSKVNADPMVYGVGVGYRF